MGHTESGHILIEYSVSGTKQREFYFKNSVCNGSNHFSAEELDEEDGSGRVLRRTTFGGELEGVGGWHLAAPFSAFLFATLCVRVVRKNVGAKRGGNGASCFTSGCQPYFEFRAKTLGGKRSAMGMNSSSGASRFLRRTEQW